MGRVKIRQLGYVGTTATDMEAWYEFAAGVLGAEIATGSNDDCLYLRFDDHHHRLAVHRGVEDDVAFVGWELGNPGALAEACADLERAELIVKAGTPEECLARAVHEMVWFECPFTGVRTELFVGAEVQFQPAFLPTRPIGSFVTGDGGMGHVVLYTSDVVAAERFYAEVMGFGTTDRVVIPGMGQFSAFMHCNERHHSLGLMAIPNAPRKMQHIMFELADLDAVGTTYDVCLGREITTTSLGRHLNDRAFSFYFRSPSGWHFEYGWSPRVIDPRTWRLEVFNPTRPSLEWGHDGLISML